MSPLRMWLNSCATTPCSSSRFSSVAAPRVTAMAASAGELPAANALMPSSFSSTYTSGMVTPEAMAISSTTLCRRLQRRIARAALDARAAERARHHATTGAQRQGLEQAGAADDGQHDDAGDDHRAAGEASGSAAPNSERRRSRRSRAPPAPRTPGTRAAASASCDARLPGGRRSPRLCGQVKLTFGASRASGLAASSSCAGVKLNMPAMTLPGNISRWLL